MFKDSYIINQISETSGKSSAELMEELERREKFIHDMIELGIDNQKDVAEKVLSYYVNARIEKEAKKEKLSEPAGEKKKPRSRIRYTKKKPIEANHEPIENIANPIMEENS